MIVGVVLVGCVLASGYARHLMRIDPFANLANKNLNVNSVMATVKNVDVVQYHKDQLMGRAHVGEMDLRSDRQTFDLSNVYDGVLYTDRGRIDFTAQKAAWDAGRLQLAVDSGANVSNGDFDLRVPSFIVDQRSGMLTVPKEIHGRFFGGQISARNFIYNLNTGSGTIGPSVWSGKPNLKQDTGDNAPTKWTFKSGGTTFSKGGIEVWSDSEATDGEVIVQAKTIERNTKTDVITATGDCLYFSKKANMAADKVVVYRKEKRAVMTGNVRMLIKPKDSMERELKADTGEIPPFRPVVPENIAANNPVSDETDEEKQLDDEIRSGKTTRKYPSVVLSNQAEYWYGKGNRHAIITGSPQATQQLAGDRWRKGWATKVLYDAEKETMRLVSTDGKEDVRMKNSLGDDLTAAWFELSTKEDDDDWSAYHLHGDVRSDEDTSNAGGDNQPSTNPPPADKGTGKPPAVH